MILPPGIARWFDVQRHLQDNGYGTDLPVDGNWTVAWADEYARALKDDYRQMQLEGTQR